MAQIVPTIKVRISAHPLSEEREDPLTELVMEETIVNSQPAITQAVSEFSKFNRSQGIKTGPITIVRI